jgi:hypothetical protein
MKNFTSPFELKLRGEPGADFDECANHALRMACTLLLTVTYDFNGVKCYVRPGDDIALLWPNYLISQNTLGDFKPGAFCNKIPEKPL